MHKILPFAPQPVVDHVAVVDRWRPCVVADDLLFSFCTRWRLLLCGHVSGHVGGKARSSVRSEIGKQQTVAAKLCVLLFEENGLTAN